MLNENYLLRKNKFASKSLFTGLRQDQFDSRDYKFSDLIKMQETFKTVKKQVTKLVSPKRGMYRKPGYGKVVEKITIYEDIPVKNFMGNMPSQIDYSQNASPVKDQGMLGTCVAFGASAMKECQEKTEHNREIDEGKKGSKNKEYDYSEQWIYWNCKKIDAWPGEEGTDLRSAMKVLNKIGVPTEAAWEYSDSSINIGEPKSWAHLIAKWAVIGSYWSIGNLIELKIALQDSPVLIGVPVFIEWADPYGGIINYPANPNIIYGGHCVCVVGYDDNRQLIKFKNSWSEDWGDNGYGYLSYRYIEDFLWSAWAARDITVTKDMLKGTASL